MHTFLAADDFGGLLGGPDTEKAEAIRSRIANAAQIDATLGRKFDSGKLRYDLLPADAIAFVVKVLTFGAKKYAPDNWRFVEDGPRRYYSAALRHIEAWRAGEWLDPETGLPHLAHAICCLLFALARGEAYPGAKQ